MPRFKSKKPRVVTPPSPAQEVVPAARQGSSPTDSDNSEQQVSSEGSRRVSPGTLGARIIQEVKRGGSAVRRGLVTIGEGFGTRTPSASVRGVEGQQSSPPSPSHPAAPSSETASDQLAPLPSTPKKGLRFRTSFNRLPKAGFKRAASEAMSDSEGSLGSSRGAGSTGTPAARLTDFGPIKDTALNSSAGASEMLVTPPATPFTRLPFPPAETDSPTPALKVKYDAARKQTVPAEEEQLSIAPMPTIPGAQYPLTLLDLESSAGENVGPPVMTGPTARGVPIGTPQDQHALPKFQRHHIVKLRDLLVDLFQGLDRLPRWYPLMDEIADEFEAAFGQQADCSELIDAVPPDGDELEVPMPSSDVHQLEEVRRSFMAMAPNVTTHIEEQSQQRHFSFKDRWTLPASAREDPLGFWGKIWDSFDFSSPQFFDTTLTYEEQDPDTALYMITLDRIYEQKVNLPLTMRGAHLRHEDEQEKASMYYIGCIRLQEHLGASHGIRIRPRRQEPAIPFPWLDCELSRLTALNWELELGAEDYDILEGPSWSVCYHDGLDHHDTSLVTPTSRHFEPHSSHNLLLTNVRVPLPRRILEDAPSLGIAMHQLYGEYHPLKMLGQACTLARDLCGIRSQNVDIKAAMLYLVVKRISNANPSIFDLLLNDDRHDPPEVGAV